MFYRPTSVWSWILLTATVVETGIVLTLESIIFSILNENLRPGLHVNPITKTVPTFLTLLIFGFIYQTFLLYDTLADKNMIQLGGLCIYSASLCIYTILQIKQIRLAVHELAALDSFIPSSVPVINMQYLSYANASVTGFYTAVIVFASSKLYAEFQWTIYRLLNADLAMQHRYFSYKIFVALLKFDCFFFLGFIIQILVVLTGTSRAEFISTFAIILASLITLIGSAWFMRRENKTGMVAALILQIALLATFIWKLVRLYQPEHEASYLPVRSALSSFGYIAIILSSITIVVGVKCMLNFDKGLKPHITSHREAQSLLEDHEMEIMAVDIQRFYTSNV